MTATFSPAGDEAVFDGTETVTLFRRLTTSTFDGGTAVPLALRREATKEELGGGRTLAQTGMTWRVWADQISGAAPKVNDVIEDGGNVRWSVVRLTSDQITGQYVLTTIRER